MGDSAQAGPNPGDESRDRAGPPSGAAQDARFTGNRKRARRRQRRKAGQQQVRHPASSATPDSKASEAGLRHRRAPARAEKPAVLRNPARRHQDHDGRDSRKDAAQGEAAARVGGGKANGARQAQRRKPDCYAALDLGTNNCRLLVAIPQGPGQFRVIDAFSRIVRLGEGLGATGLLKQQSMDRAIEALQMCAAKLRTKNIRRQRLIATEACRRAVNGQEFLDRVREETGLDLEIVDRETEARLAVSGCSSLVDRQSEGVVLFDIGGGSSELALLDVRSRSSRRLSDNIAAWTSLPLGVVTLAEKHGGEHVTRPVFDGMVEEVMDLLAAFDGRDALSEAMKNKRIHLLGTSGTVTTLAGVHLNLARYDRRQVDGIWLNDAEVSAMMDRLLSMDFQARMQNPCIGRERADLVLAGCAILEAIRQTWPCEMLRVADRGLREGLLTEMMADDGAWRRRPDRFGRRQHRPGHRAEGGLQ